MTPHVSTRKAAKALGTTPEQVRRMVRRDWRGVRNDCHRRGRGGGQRETVMTRREKDSTTNCFVCAALMAVAAVLIAMGF